MMIILGTKYRFTEFDRKHLNGIELIELTYADKSPKEVIEEIEKILHKSQTKTIVLNTRAPIPDELLAALTKLELRGVRYISIEHFLENYLHKCYIPDDRSNIDYLDAIRPFTPWQYTQKRLIDFAIAIPLALLTAPIMLYSAYRIKKESPEGPIIYKQKRVGKGGKEFVCYKFRSMIPDAEKERPQFASENDPRVFKWGAFMRKTRIDELPQIWNVLKGEMHMIGPRPERKYWIDQFEKEIPYYNQRHLIAPGITGWAQVNYRYGNDANDAKQKLMYDLYYIKNWNLWLEIKTIFKTIVVMAGKQGR